MISRRSSGIAKRSRVSGFSVPHFALSITRFIGSALAVSPASPNTSLLPSKQAGSFFFYAEYYSVRSIFLAVAPSARRYLLSSSIASKFNLGNPNCRVFRFIHSITLSHIFLSSYLLERLIRYFSFPS